MKATEIIACINARLPNVESFQPHVLGPQCVGVWSIQQGGLSCRLEIAADERWETYPVRLLVPLRSGPCSDAAAQRLQSALKRHTLEIERRVDGDVPWILVRFHLWQGFYVEGLPWIIDVIVRSVAQAADGTSSAAPSSSLR